MEEDQSFKHRRDNSNNPLDGSIATVRMAEDSSSMKIILQEVPD